MELVRYLVSYPVVTRELYTKPRIAWPV